MGRQQAERLERIRAARAALEAEARQDPADLDPDGPGPSSGMQKDGKPERAEDGGPPERAQRNFTDPDSRILPTRDGVIQGYNGRVAVDAELHVIVSQHVATTAADYGGLIPLVDAAHAALGRKPREVSGDTGFATEENLAAMKERRIVAYLPPARGRHGDDNAAGERRLRYKPRMMAMAGKLRRAGHRSQYRLRKQVVEPVFGQIKQARGFRQFLLRSLTKIRSEWAMICTAHNLLKLAAGAA